MGNKGITNAFEAEMMKMDFGEYLRNTIGDHPNTDPDVKWYAHHILFKKGNNAAQQALVVQGQAILRKYGIDPIVGPENLVWASLYAKGQHAYPALEAVVEELVAIDQAGGGYDDIVESLQNFGRVASERR
jgi:hypothetical protein